ncbi:isoprenylcysteine carboxylmethyltransferase family protein [Aeromonas taiwanensis]|uniref:Isoprenylcysteine carboxylmethyltransferase family protein n=1 Tax=Aeromonas taiwanensis TaxID=633417 RepID=A0A5F0K387_9GAMM|nr:isoprenylcysteine carboxylmethyltransferase family protein [Aeromonas taiwanensis]TFF70581.1 isoprenylcysteine carboxylmethyltransferase family protein [Aeromonas taiwanensis]TFF71166.1 isoprenylcysteine carboxylmethyltransferase family protein [Aeromonas taiwanensis]TFF73552.1 isoprenylcysteine carboxylmethyltransferase family protein [Aeromonas taiwanensis]
MGGLPHVLFFSQKMNKLAITGPYSKIRHPQYVAFAMIMFGFLLQWPTILTLLMFPILLIMYKHLALTEEREVRSIFGKAYDDYANKTPRFIPSWKVRS